MPLKTRFIFRNAGPMALCLFYCASAAPAWGPGNHIELAQRYYNDPLIAQLAAEFATDVPAVVRGAGELDYVGNPHHRLYHRGQWRMVRSRTYIRYGHKKNPWYDIDETTRLKYIMHNLGDVAVPIGHSPANRNKNAKPGTTKEAFFEGLANIGKYGNPSASKDHYTGRISECVDQFYAETMANTQYFAENVRTGLLSVVPYENARKAAQQGWKLSQKLALVVLADYYLAKRPAACAGGDITVTPGERAVFSARHLRDPDNIVWNADGTYRYDASWTGIKRVRWDLDGDGTFETSGLHISRTYAQLAERIGAPARIVFGIEVTDDEGVLTYDTAVLMLGPKSFADDVIAETRGWLVRRATSQAHVTAALSPRAVK